MMAKSLFHTFELGFKSFYFMILEHDIANANEHFGWRRRENIVFAAFAIYLEKIDNCKTVIIQLWWPGQPPE